MKVTSSLECNVHHLGTIWHNKGLMNELEMHHGEIVFEPKVISRVVTLATDGSGRGTLSLVLFPCKKNIINANTPMATPYPHQPPKACGYYPVCFHVLQLLPIRFTHTKLMFALANLH